MTDEDFKKLGWWLETTNQWYAIWVKPNGNKAIIRHEKRK